MSSESIASQTLPTTAESCVACGASLADDQRYCLQCGERRFPMSTVLLAGPSPALVAQPRSADVSPAPGAAGPAADAEGRGNAVTVMAGVGVLLLAMGVGVLIGRSGSFKPSAAASAPVISVVPASPAGAAAAAVGATSFTGDWPPGTSGYTLQLQTLPVSGTQTSEVEAAKSAARAKGAKGVGALKSEEFASLKAGDYVVYSGVYRSKAEAEKARKGLRTSFPSASVIRVSNAASSTTSKASSSFRGSGVGASETHPAPPTVVESLKKTTKGKSYEERSKNLPDVISTG